MDIFLVGSSGHTKVVMDAVWKAFWVYSNPKWRWVFSWKKPSVADIIMEESLTSFISFSPTWLNNHPQLKRLNQLQEVVVSERNIKGCLNTDNRWRLPEAQYVIDIARVCVARFLRICTNSIGLLKAECYAHPQALLIGCMTDRCARTRLVINIC